MNRRGFRHVSWITAAAFTWASTGTSSAFARTGSRRAPALRCATDTREVPRGIVIAREDGYVAGGAGAVGRPRTIVRVHPGMAPWPARAGEHFLRDGALHAVEPPDTAESVFDFPEEEKKNRHLARDITVFVIVSAFVAAFVIEVFIKGDTDTPVDNSPPGKTIP